MDFRYREALRMSRIFLLENVIFETLVDHLIDQDIFSDSMLETISAGQDRLQHIRRMLEYLSKRPDSCFERFLCALRNSGHEHCAETIAKNYLKTGPVQVSDPTANGHLATHLPQNVSNGHNAMEISSVGTQESCPPATGKSYGFPETASSMQGYAGSFESRPVQESSSCKGEVVPTPVSNLSILNETGMDIEPSGSVYQGGDSHREFPPSNDSMSEYERHFLCNPEGVYRMDTNPRGLALIINNENFWTMKARPGSKRDSENLHGLLKKLGFDVCIEVNKTAKDMRSLMKSFSQHEPLSRVASLVVIILSHGGRRGEIYGTDGRTGDKDTYITDEEVQSAFSARNCPYMAEKPKLVIVQACRGHMEDAPENAPQPRPQAARTASETCIDGISLPSHPSTASSGRRAAMADMCLIHSTVPGYVSYRHPVEGSPFIQVLTDVFQRLAAHQHLNDMMTEVVRVLASKPLPDDLRTVPSNTNTLTKKWYLNPLHIF